MHIAGTGPLDPLFARTSPKGKSLFKWKAIAAAIGWPKYRHAAFMVLPSEQYENASMSALESFAYGKPVLASRIGGNPELVRDGESGRLFTPGNVEELASAMRSMWANKDELVMMGKRGRSLIEQDFAQESD